MHSLILTGEELSALKELLDFHHGAEEHLASMPYITLADKIKELIPGPPEPFTDSVN